MTTPISAPPSPALAPSPPATGDLITHTLRLVRWDLFQTWRRVMAKVLLGILLGIFLVIVAGVLLAYGAASGSAASSGNTTGADVIRNLITFPLSTGLAVQYTTFMGVVLLSIMAGVLVGGEFGFGTQRLALTRGVGRGQALASKILTLAALAAATVAGMLLLGTLIGITLGPALGGTPDRLSFAGFAQLLSFWLATSLRLFAYSLVGLFFGTLGRSTAAGVGGALGFVAVELVAWSIITGIVSSAIFAARQFGSPLPSWVGTLTLVRASMLKTVLDAFGSAASQGPLNLGNANDITRAADSLVTPPSALQSVLVIVLWCVALIGFSYLLLRTRDVSD